MFEFNGHNMYVNMGTDICLKNIDHLQVFDIGDVDIGYVGPHISGPAPALIEVPLQDNDNDDGEDDSDENDEDNNLNDQFSDITNCKVLKLTH